MWKSCRIAAAQDCCRKMPHGREMKQASAQEVATTRRDDEASGYGNDTEITAEEGEKSKLFIHTVAGGADGLCHGKRHCISSSLCRLPSKAVMASKGLTSTLRAFFIFQLKKLPTTSDLRSCCDMAKRKCTITLTGPVLCFPFPSQFEEEESSMDQEMRACLVDLGIHVRTPVLHCHRRFRLHELSEATSHFAEKNMLGKGSSGCVYRGELASAGLSVAVKVLNVRLKDARLSFVTELEIMCHVRDRHIQPLLGYCVEDGHLLLVYTYMPQGSLEAWLHDDHTQGKAGVRNRCKLSWNDRRKIAIGITKALHYLHTECRPPIIHRDVKSSNILLTRHNDPKLTDFGLAIKASLSNSICKDIMGTFGYLAPEYFQSGKVSTKMDIYSLGIVLLELMTGRQPINNDVPFGGGNLANWARHLICNTRGCTVGMADPALGTSYSSTGMQKLLCIAALCIHPVDSQRPSIRTVLAFMQEEPAVRLHWLVMEAYRDASCRISHCPSFSSDHCNKDMRKSEEDLRKQYLEMAMRDVEERSSLLCSPLIVL